MVGTTATTLPKMGISRLFGSRRKPRLPFDAAAPSYCFAIIGQLSLTSAMPLSGSLLARIGDVRSVRLGSRAAAGRLDSLLPNVGPRML
jgi:hypothetical protein